MYIKLNSFCYGVEPLKFSWTPYNSNDIIETIKWVYFELPDLKSAIIHNVLQCYDPLDYESMKELSHRFNNVIRTFVRLERGTSFPQKRNKIPCQGLLKHILHVTYNQSVKNPVKLNQYEPFSAQVYGETSSDFIFQMIKQIKISQDDIFIDLGSGVGQVVLQMAAATSCKLCVGIEQADIPCNYAETMATQFKIFMNWFGKKCGQFKLLKGNFFDEKFQETINSSTIIFVNNFAFGPLVDHQLKERFFKMKNGTQIISSKNFCPLNLRITERNINDIEAIMKVRKLKGNGTVSWTDSSITYYLHKITRKNLELYKNGDLPKYNSNSDSDESKDENQLWQWNSSNHSEVESIPETKTTRPRNIPKINLNKIRKSKKVIPKIPALNKLLRIYKRDMLNMLELMKLPNFKQNLQKQIEEEQQKKEYLEQVADQIQADIDNIERQNLVLVKSRLNELDLIKDLDINHNNLAPMTAFICSRQYHLRQKVAQLEIEVKNLEVENQRLLLQ